MRPWMVVVLSDFGRDRIAYQQYENLIDPEVKLRALPRGNIHILKMQAAQAVLDWLHARGAFAARPPGLPALLVLDLKMPKVNGLEVLQQIKADPAFRALPVVILTSSREEQDVVQSYHLGVNAYVVKPVEYQSFIEAVSRLGVFWALINEPAPAQAPSPHENSSP